MKVKVKKKVINNEQGAVMILIAFMIVVLMGFTALVIDIGMVYAEHIRLSNACDAAALAGSVELLNNSASRAEVVAGDYLEANGFDRNLAVIDASDEANNRYIEVTGTANVDHWFAPVIGIDNSDVSAHAKVRMGPLSSPGGGLRPIVILDDTNFAPEDKYQFGDQITLKYAPGDGEKGNYGTIALGGTGSNVLTDNLLNGYTDDEGLFEGFDEEDESTHVVVDTEPGADAHSTGIVKNYINNIDDELANYSDPDAIFTEGTDRVWFIPIVEEFDVAGRDEVIIVGFKALYVTDVKKVNGKMEIVGEFIQAVTYGEIDMSIDETNASAFGVELVE